MRRAEDDDAEVHSKVENFEELRFGEGENDDTEALGQSDSTENLKKKKFESRNTSVSFSY